jgi:hypothetical protein
VIYSDAGESESQVPKVSCIKLNSDPIRTASPEEPMKVPTHMSKAVDALRQPYTETCEEGSGIDHLVQLWGSRKGTQRSYMDIVGMRGSYGLANVPNT